MEMKFSNKERKKTSPQTSPNQTTLSYEPFNGWNDIPVDEIPPLAVEIMGTYAMGKTHMASTFPNPALCDTEEKGWVVWRKSENKRYFKAED